MKTYYNCCDYCGAQDGTQQPTAEIRPISISATCELCDLNGCVGCIVDGLCEKCTKIENAPYWFSEDDLENVKDF